MEVRSIMEMKKRWKTTEFNRKLTGLEDQLNGNKGKSVGDGNQGC
jgi:hypothetical protein